MVKAKDQRLFRQILELKWEKPARDKVRTSNERDPPTWCGHLATPRPRFRGLLGLVGEAFAPPIFVRPPRLVFAYKYCIFREKGTKK